MTTETSTPEEIWNEEASLRDEPVVVEQAAPEPEQNPEPVQAEETQAAPVEEEDPYAGLPEAAKERLRKLDELERSQVQLLQQVRTAEGRVSAMQRELSEAKKAAATADGPSQGQMAAAAKSLQKWEQLKSDFPEWAEAMEEYVAAQKPAQSAPVDLDARVEEHSNAIVAKYEKQRIERKYRNWEQEVRTPEFGTWLNGQTEDVRALAASPISDDAIELLSKYYATKEVKQERQTRLAAAASAKPRPATAPTGRSLEDLSPEELWAYEAAEREKRRQRIGA